MIIRLNSFLRNLLFIFIAVYFAQGAFYETGSIISKLALFLILLISFYYLLKTLGLNFNKGLYYYVLIAFLLLNALGFLIAGHFDGVHFAHFKIILTALLPFFPFYYFAYKGVLNQKHLLCFFIFLLPIAIFTFYFSRSNILIEQLVESENVVVNTAYFFVALIPYVFLFGRRKVLSILTLFLLLFFIIQSAKRGALIIGLAGSLVFVYYHLNTVEPKKKLRSYMAVLLGVSIASIFLYRFYLTNDFLVERLERISDGGSGRDIIYSSLFNSWYESNSVINYLFGFGFVSSIEYSGGFLAHNDWLELLMNFGLLGIFTYLLIFFAIMQFILNPRVKKEHRLITLSIISMWFLQTLFSMFYASSLTSLTSVMLGYLLGTYQRQKTTTWNIKANENTLHN